MFKKQFTDVYGATHTAAIFEVSNVNVYATTNTSIYLNEMGTAQKELDGNITIEFSGRFWVSEQAKELGHLPMVFSIIDPNDRLEKNIFLLENIENPHDLSPEQLMVEAEKVMLSLVTQGQV